ncbi:Tryptophan synthase alpha chain [bacterium HR19]|nr:Tryptophan synthase alpha chain [bacterium HR19]
MKICAYFTCGFPDLESSFKIMREILKVADMLEIGIPFSDPIADGETIQFASAKALEMGFKVSQAFQVAEKLKSEFPQKKILFMTYYNIIVRKGLEEFIRKSKDVGIWGIIVPDIIPEESFDFCEIMKKNELKTVFFVSPLTPEKRIKKISSMTTGFIYYISTTGVTGEREKLPEGIKSKLKDVKNKAQKEIFVGFGISKREHVKELEEVADGVIVGSALIRKVIESRSFEEAEKKITSFLKELKGEK